MKAEMSLFQVQKEEGPQRILGKNVFLQVKSKRSQEMRFKRKSDYMGQALQLEK